MNYACTWTTYGLEQLAACATNGGHLQLSQMALGDAGGTPYEPTADATSLVHEVYRAPLTNIMADASNPNWIIAEMVIPASVGGWYVREAGLYDVYGSLVYIGNYAEAYKPIFSDGQVADLCIRMVLQVTNTAVIQLQVDPSVVMASQSYVQSLTQSVRSDLSITAQIPGGRKTQVLVKKSDGDGDVVWRDTYTPEFLFHTQG